MPEKRQVAVWPTVSVCGQGGRATHTEPQSCPPCATSIPASGTGRVTRTQEGGADPKWEDGVSGSTAGGAVVCWGCYREPGCGKGVIAAVKNRENKAVLISPAGVRGLFPSHSQPAQGPLPTDTLHPRGCA